MQAPEVSKANEYRDDKRKFLLALVAARTKRFLRECPYEGEDTPKESDND